MSYNIVMYFVSENCEKAGFYECRECGYRFLSELTDQRIECPNCANDIDYEIGPDESIDDYINTAVLLEIIEGNENIQRYDSLLSSTFVDNEAWID